MRDSERAVQRHPWAAAAVIIYGGDPLRVPLHEDAGPNGVITIPRDRPAAAAALEKLHTITVGGFQDPLQEQELCTQGAPAISSGPLDAEIKTAGSPEASTSTSGGTAAHNNAEQVSTKIVQIGAKPSQTARIGGGLGAK